MPYESFITISSPRGTSLKSITDEIDSIWSELKQDPRKGSRLPDVSPFHVGRPEAQFDVATTILVSVAAGVAKDSVEAAWQRWIWPELRRRLGISEDEQPNAGAR